jgi:hypothetical protein
MRLLARRAHLVMVVYLTLHAPGPAARTPHRQIGPEANRSCSLIGIKPNHRSRALEALRWPRPGSALRALAHPVEGGKHELERAEAGHAKPRLKIAK